MRRRRVESCLASSTQQMNSLRARGVMSFHAASAAALALSVVRRSVGILCTTPPGTGGQSPPSRSIRDIGSPFSRSGQELFDEDRGKPLLVAFCVPAAVVHEQAKDLGRGERVDDVGRVALLDPVSYTHLTLP